MSDLIPLTALAWPTCQQAANRGANIRVHVGVNRNRRWDLSELIEV